MADENSFLGTSGKDSLPYEYQVEQQRAARKRQMAQALMQNGMKGPRPVQMFGNHASIPGVGEHLVSALQTYMGGKRLADQDTEDAALTQRIQTDQRDELSGVMDARNNDPRGAIARALAGRFAPTRAMGAQWQKGDEARVTEQGKLIGAADPAAGARFMQGNDPYAAVPTLADQPPTEFKDSMGNVGQISYDRTGKPTVTYAPKGTTVTNDIKLGAGADEEAIKYFNYGGKGYDIGMNAGNALQNTANLLDTLDKNPTMGAGAGGIQFIRKWAQTLGAPVNENTTPTEMASMQLGQKTLDRLGGLGAQVSDADRKFMLETQGSLTNDPEAVRKMLLIEAKYLMQLQAKTSGQANEVAGRRPGVTLPTHGFSFTPSQRNADDIERLMTGQGFAPPAPPEVRDPVGRIRRKP
jgi:hypothetical protein